MSGNLMSKVSMNLQPRLVSLPWLKRSVVRCFSHKSDGPDMPVRYIPKKLGDLNKPGCSSSGDNAPKDVIHTKSSSIRPPGSTTYHHPSNVLFHDAHGTHTQLNKDNSYYVDGAMGIEYLEDDVEEAQLQLHDGIDEAGQESFQTCWTKRDVEKMAVVLLAKRAFTRFELKKKLIAKNFPINVVEAVVSDFQNRGLINDRLYAETFSHSRWKSSSWGPRRIKQALVKKGVSEGDVKEAVKLVFEDSGECDLGLSTRLSSSSLQQLYVQSSKQWQRSQNVPHETRKARVIRWLQYRGFDWAVVSMILKKLESEYPP